MAEAGETCDNGTWSGIQGKCTGNTGGTGDVSCAGGDGTTAANTQNKGASVDGSTVAACCEAPPTCDDFVCPRAFTLRDQSEASIPCAGTTCDKFADLYTCCFTTDAIYGRTENSETDCNNQNCHGSNKCTDGSDKVTKKCKCVKDTIYGDGRYIVADVGDYCDADGLWAKTVGNKKYDESSDTRTHAELKIDWGIPISDTLYAKTKNYIKGRNSTDEKKDLEEFGFVEEVVAVGGIQYKCADKCLLNYRNEEFHRETRRRLRANNLKAASAADYTKRGSDTCKDRECTLCPQCRKDAAIKTYGYKPRIHAFVSPTGVVDQHDAGCEDTCETVFGQTYTDSGTFVVTAPTTTVSMTSQQKNTNFADKKSVLSTDAAGTMGSVLTINGRVGAETYAIAGEEYEIVTTTLSNCNFAIKHLNPLADDIYVTINDNNKFEAPAAGTHLQYECSDNTDVIGGIIKVHRAQNIQKIKTCNGQSCSGCTKCKELLGTAEFGENTVADATCTVPPCTAPVDLFAPVSPEEDINGDGSRIAGGCKAYCEKAYTGVGRYWPALRGQSLSPTLRKDNVCSWQRCSGCLQCKKRALTDDFAQLEPLSDYGDTKHTRTKMKRMGGCSMPRRGDSTTNCKAAWTVAGDTVAAKLEMCQTPTDDRDCSGCKQCRTFVTTAIVASDRVKYGADGCKLKGGGAWCTKTLAIGTSAQSKRIQKMGCVSDCF